MKDYQVAEALNKIFNAVFNQPNPFNINQIMEKFAFDVKLPKEVTDSTTGEITYANSVASGKFITQANQAKRDEKQGWMLPKQRVGNMQDLINIWRSINLTTTERSFDSINVSKSDTIYACENVYRSTDCRGCKNIIFCEGSSNVQYGLAVQRSNSCNFCIRSDDSKDCTNCYSVQFSNKLINCYFCQDCFNLNECIFCAHIANKKYCIANMQFDEKEYFAIKKVIINWIFKS